MPGCRGEFSGLARGEEDFARQGEQALKKEDYKKAIALFTKAIKANPKYAANYRGRGDACHCNPEMLNAAIEQLRQLQHTTTIYLTEPMLAIACAIAELAPAPLRPSFFCASGSEANEGALLLAALATGRQEFVYLREGLHGRTKWAMSVTGLDMWRTDPHPLLTAHGVPGPRLTGLNCQNCRANEAAVFSRPEVRDGFFCCEPSALNIGAMEPCRWPGNSESPR